jgi:hypothetical protein
MRSARVPRARKRTKQGAKIRILVPFFKGDLGGFTPTLLFPTTDIRILLSLLPSFENGNQIEVG